MVTVTLGTALGPVSVDATADKVVRIRLHPRQAAISPTSGRPPSPWLQHLGQRIARHLEGDTQDFSTVPLDLSGVSEFARQVYQELRGVRAGTTLSYKALACRVDRPQGARAVARAMAANPCPIIIPCHRVVAASGALTGFSGGDGVLTKALLLASEGVLPRVSRADLAGASIFDPAIYQMGLARLRQDPLFARLLDTGGEEPPVRAFGDNPFASLVQAICYQQLAGAAAATIYGRVKKALGGEPTVERLRAAPDAALVEAGLSGGKRRAVRALVHAVENGQVDLGRLSVLPYQTLKEQLTAVPGIGPWTVEMVAIFHLGYPDIFSPGDLGVRKAIARLLGRWEPVTPEEATRVARRWQPFSTLATLALWRSLGTVTME